MPKSKKMTKKGLSQLDAEVVNSFSSAYKGTAESEVAAKKPHKNEENRQFLLAIFNFMRNLHLKSSAFSISLFRWLLFCAKLDSTFLFKFNL